MRFGLHRWLPIRFVFNTLKHASSPKADRQCPEWKVAIIERSVRGDTFSFRSSPPTAVRPDENSPFTGWATCGGRSPGSRVAAGAHLPGFPVAILNASYPPTVAGAAAVLTIRSNLTAFPFFPLRGNHHATNPICRQWTQQVSRSIENAC